MKMAVKGAIGNKLINEQGDFCLKATPKKFHNISMVYLRKYSNLIYKLIDFSLYNYF